MWKPVVGYEELFLISDKGELKRISTNRVLKQHVNKHGYCNVSTRIGGRNGKAVCFKIHRLVAEAFLEPPTDDQVEWARGVHYGVVEVNHKDGDKTNNVYTNLEWATGSSNMKHAAKNNLLTIKKSEDVSQAKLTDDQVIEIRKRYIPGCRINGARAMSSEFGVSHSQISRVARGKRFKHLKSNTGVV